MADEGASALRDMREALRQPIPTLDDFTFLLSSTLQAISLHPSSAPSASSPATLRAIERHCGTIQLSLLSTAVPTFLHALDARGRELLDAFFCPVSQSVALARAAQGIALSAYTTLPALLSGSATSGVAPLPIGARGYVLEVLGRLAERYGLEVLYDAVWSGGEGGESSKDGIMRVMRWEEVVRAAVSLPAKVGNAAGRRKAEGWAGEVPENLDPKPYFDHLVHDLARLTVRVSRGGDEGAERLRVVYERLAAVGLLVPKASTSGLNVPSLLPALLPTLLGAISEAHTNAAPRLSFAPVFLALPSATLNAFVDSLLSHLVLHIKGPLEPDSPSQTIALASRALEAIIGPAQPDSDAWDAVLRSATTRRTLTSPQDPAEVARARLIVAWVASGPASARGTTLLVDALLDRWTDSKWIKFSPFSTHFAVTHLLLLALGQLGPAHPYASQLSTSGRFIVACQAYLAHPDASVRRLGMLVAEVLSALTVPEDEGDAALGVDDRDETEELMAGLELDGEGARKKKVPVPVPKMRRLRFGASMWEGQGQGREEARWLRRCVGLRDAGLGVDVKGENGMLGWDKVDEVRLAPESAQQPARGRSPVRDTLRGSKADSKPKPKTKAKTPRKVVMLDEEDDPMSGYSSPSASSSRSASPTPSYLEEVANDPTLALDSTKRSKLQRPVYIPQLLALLRDHKNPDAIEMGLNHGEALVRAKRHYGTELSELAKDLAGALVGLNDPYNIEDFEERRDKLARAVVACAPRQAAPYLIEQYFSNTYSLQQKSIMLTALAMGARELAGLHVPEAAPNSRRIDFPSKTLPLALHRQYISEVDQTPRLGARVMGQIDLVTDEIRGLLLSKGAKRAEEAVPEIAREKRLRVGTTTRTRRIAEEGTLESRQMDEAMQRHLQPPAPVVPYREVAAEFFVLPLINRFWQLYQDSNAREARAMGMGSRYRGAGAGMALSPMALERFVSTLSLLVHAARHASVFLAVIVPEALELAVTLGAKHAVRPEDHVIEDEHDADAGADGGQNPEAQVLGAALELALVCLDGAGEVDGGRSLVVDRSEMVLAAGEWAQGVFDAESRGGRVAQGQAREGRIRAASAGVVVKVAEMAERWGRMGGMR